MNNKTSQAHELIQDHEGIHFSCQGYADHVYGLVKNVNYLCYRTDSAKKELAGHIEDRCWELAETNDHKEMRELLESEEIDFLSLAKEYFSEAKAEASGVDLSPPYAWRDQP